MTALEIYDMAANLLACKNNDGSDNPDCEDYIARAPSLINILLAENIKLERLLSGDKKARPTPIAFMEDEVKCHELLAYDVLPYGLASLLVIDEDPELSNVLYERYLMNIKTLKETPSAVLHGIEDRYKYYG